MDGAGNMNSTAFKITSMDSTPPSALIICPSNVTQGDMVQLDGSGSTDNVGISNWTWWIEFQGETRSCYGEMVTFRPDDKGLYHITLQVMDERGFTSSDSRVMEVRESGNGGGIDIDPWLLLLLIILASIFFMVVMVLSLLLILRRKGREEVEIPDVLEEKPVTRVSFRPPPRKDDFVTSGSLYSDLEE
jgi:hypothetical protein